MHSSKAAKAASKAAKAAAVQEAEVALYGRLSTTTAPLTAHVSIVATSDNTVKLTIVDARNSIRDLDTGELITIDGVDGVVRLSSTNDVVLLDMSCLARRWVE